MSINVYAQEGGIDLIGSIGHSLDMLSTDKEHLELSVKEIKGKLRFEWNMSVSDKFEWYKLVFSDTNPEPIYEQDVLVSEIGDKEQNRLENVNKKSGYRRVCIIYTGFDEAENKDDYRTCSNAIRTNKIENPAQGLSYIEQGTKAANQIDQQNIDKIIHSIGDSGVFNLLLELKLYEAFGISKPNDMKDLEEQLGGVDMYILESISTDIDGLVAILQKFKILRNQYRQLSKNGPLDDYEKLLEDFNSFKEESSGMISEISNSDRLDYSSFIDSLEAAYKNYSNDIALDIKILNGDKFVNIQQNNNFETEQTIALSQDEINNIQNKDYEAVKVDSKEICDEKGGNWQDGICEFLKETKIYYLGSSELQLINYGYDAYYIFNSEKGGQDFNEIYTDKDSLIKTDKDILITSAFTRNNTRRLLIFIGGDVPKTMLTLADLDVTYYNFDDGYLYFEYDNQGKEGSGEVLLYNMLISGEDNDIPVVTGVDNMNIQDTGMVFGFVADISQSSVGLTLLVVVISIITVFVVMFLIDYIKGRGKRIDLIKEVDKIIKKQGKIKSQKSYQSDLYALYTSFKDNGYILSPKFLMNFIISLKTRGFMILLGGNGVGKTAFVEKFVRALYGSKYEKFYQKVIITSDMDDEKKFLGLYDRLNNNYLDPYGITQIIANAYLDRENPYIILLDEINMQDVEKYFPYFTDSDKVLNERESDFIKVGELSEADSDDLKKAKLRLIDQYNFIIQKEDKIYEFGYKIPDNIFIIGTANVDKSVEPFTGKVLDRSDVIKFKYMGDKDYTQEEELIKGQGFSMIRGKEWLKKEDLDNIVLAFVQETIDLWEVSKRTDKSLCYYALSVRDIDYLTISRAVNQKILTKAFGPEYRVKLEKFLEICKKYNKDLILDETIDEVESLLQDDFINFWKLTKT